MRSGPSFAGAKVTIFGLGRHGGGVAAAKFLAQRGAKLTITDLQDAAALAKSLTELAEFRGIKLRLSQHIAEDFNRADMVVVNPAVRPESPWLTLAKQNGAILTSEIELFLNACSARVVGVTGTVGKSTTATLLHDMLRASERTSWLGGNIGQSLLPHLENMSDTDVVVLELSSFQLAHLSENARWPTAAVLTSLDPHHVDWHGSAASYYAAKRRLLTHLPRDGWLVADCETSNHTANLACEIISPAKSTAALDAMPHNLLVRSNAQLAAAAAKQLGATVQGVQSALQAFSGLPHRLQYLGLFADRHWYDDSKATSPAATLGALSAVQGRVWLILGGVRPDMELAPFIDQVSRRACGAACIGAAAEYLAENFALRSPDFCSKSLGTQENAVAWLCQVSAPGDAILLSPGCASYDQYTDFIARGREFQNLVAALANRGAPR
jgi:UDP-N-acetylmuramoylalanine--D-glutamate ligase